MTWRSYWQKHWTSLLAACLVVLALTVLARIFLGVPGHWIITGILPAVMIAIAAILAGHASTKIYREFEIGEGSAANPAADDVRARSLARNCQAEMDRTAVASSLNREVIRMALLLPRRLNERVSETYELGSQVVHRRTILEGRIPTRLLDKYRLPPESRGKRTRGFFGKRAVQIESEKAAEQVYIPVAVFKKGELLDHFSVYDGTGASLRILNVADSLLLIGEALRSYLLAASGRSIGQRLPARFRRVEQCALKVLAHAGPSTRDVTAATAAINGLPGNSTALSLASKIVEHYAQNNVFVAPVTPGADGRFIVKFEQVLRPRVDSTKLSRSERFLLRLGVLPVVLGVDAEAAYTAQSYHAHVVGPEGLYIARQRSVHPHGDQWFHYRFREARGQAFGHFYARDLPSPLPGKTLGVLFDYYEVPPGSTLRAAITALATWALILILGLISSYKRSPISTDAAAILLVFPAVAAAWLGFEPTRGRLLEGTLAARISLAATTILSLLASGLFLAHKEFPYYYDTYIGPEGETPKESYFWYFLSGSWGAFEPLGVKDLAFALIHLAALFNACILIYTASSRSRHYERLVDGKFAL